jgi:hypothetical protein
MLEEICGIINGEVPREGLCTTADGVRFLRDRYRELREVKLELREVKRERDEAREALRQIWQSGDAAFLPYIDQETINRWRKAAGWEGLK